MMSRQMGNDPVSPDFVDGLGLGGLPRGFPPTTGSSVEGSYLRLCPTCSIRSDTQPCTMDTTARSLSGNQVSGLS